MKNIRNISYAVAAFLVTTATSCNKQLKEYNPSASTIDKQYTTPGGFVTLINMAYQDIHQLYGLEDGMFLCETGTDLWFNDSRGTYANQITQYVALASKQAQTTKTWAACYRGINYCNTGIELIDGAGFTNEAEKKSRLAELKFLRAFYYYHIVEQFGGVTLQLKSSLQGIETTKQRSTPEEFYDVMIDDLTFAKDNLPVKWPDAEYSRASKKSAAGMLAKVLLTRAYYATGDKATWFTKAKAAAEDVINNQTAYNVSLYTDYAQVGPSVYGAPGVRAAAVNKEAMFVLAYSESNIQANAYTDGKNGNRIFKWMLPKYTTRPGMSGDFAYGVDNEQRLMPTWHLLDLFDESIDARYNACFQELWISNQAWTWGPKNWYNTDKLKYYKDSLPIQGQVIAKGDTAMFFTKKEWGGKATRRYLEIDRNELYQNPVHGKGAAIYNNPDSNNFVTSCYPAFKKFVNPNRTATSTTTDFGDALIMRFAEMYLIAAEAAVQLGDQGTAMKWLNVIRDRAGLPGQKAAMLITDPSTIDIYYILDERGREFAGEEQRWYDLKRVFRTGTDWTAYILKYNPDLTSIQPYHRDRPVPLAELQALDNPQQYGQNKGYDQP